jgi:hypothetical protein
VIQAAIRQGGVVADTGVVSAVLSSDDNAAGRRLGIAQQAEDLRATS